MTGDGSWRRCSACKEPIGLGATYWTCNVSTCNRKRTGLVFCSVTCWEVHLPEANHRESWAVEQTAPRTTETPTASPQRDASQGGGRRIIPTAPTPKALPGHGGEVLIVASRLKEYIRERSGFSTSDRVLEPLSDVIRRVCDQAIENARRDGRKTVLDRDLPDA